MSRFHNDVEAERLAGGWHILGAFVAGLSVIVGLGGLWWHLWAVKQHEEHLTELEEYGHDKKRADDGYAETIERRKERIHA